MNRRDWTKGVKSEFQEFPRRYRTNRCDWVDIPPIDNEFRRCQSLDYAVWKWADGNVKFLCAEHDHDLHKELGTVGYTDCVKEEPQSA